MNIDIDPPSSVSTSERGNEGDAWPCLPLQLADRTTHTRLFSLGTHHCLRSLQYSAQLTR